MDELHSSVILRNLCTIAAMQGQYSWQALRAGVDICHLYSGPENGPVAALLRYAPGASVPEHLHVGTEFILVLSGAQSDDHGDYGAGTVLVSPPGSRHTIVSAQGCIVLAIWEKPVQFL